MGNWSDRNRIPNEGNSHKHYQILVGNLRNPESVCKIFSELQFLGKCST